MLFRLRVSTAGPDADIPGPQIATLYTLGRKKSSDRGIKQLTALGCRVGAVWFDAINRDTSGTFVKVLTDQTVISGTVPSTVRSNRAAYSSSHTGIE